MQIHTDRITVKCAYGGLFLALALILSYVEAIIPFSFGIPGIKLGLANLIIILCMYLFSGGEALIVNICRILLVSLLFTDMTSFIYSLAGAVFSFTIMVLLKKNKHLSVISVSVCGGIMHNIGQLFVAFFILQNASILYYSPILIISGLITGLLMGVLSSLIIKKYGKYFIRMSHNHINNK